MKENKFQSQLIKELHEILPGCVVLKNDANYIQGFPDLTILYDDYWFVLEVKKSSYEAFQPNQQHYIDILDSMSYARVIYPENKKEVLNEIQYLSGSRRTSRIP